MITQEKPERSGVVRSTVLGVMVFEAVEGGELPGALDTCTTTRMTRIGHIDPGGYVPAFVIDSHARQLLAQFINNIETYCREKSRVT